MKLAIIAAVLGAVSSCSTSATNTTTLITEIQAAVAADFPIGCSFLPTFETVSAIVAKGNPTVSTIGQVATAICAAVNSSGATPANPIALLAGPVPVGLVQPKVLGVEIHGRFAVKPS